MPTVRRGVGDGFTGGCVLTAQKGLHENVGVFDFLSLYPTIMWRTTSATRPGCRRMGCTGSTWCGPWGCPAATPVAGFLAYRDRAALMAVSVLRRHPRHYATAQPGVAFRLCSDGHEERQAAPKGILASIVDGFMLGASW